MKLDAEQFYILGRIFKTAALPGETDTKEVVKKTPEEESKSRTKKKKRKSRKSGYLDYRRSLVAQTRRDPISSGVGRGVTSGTLGAILGALIGRLSSSKPKAVGIGAGAGGVLGGLAGFHSGRRDALKDYSRALFLRRLGINHPGELEALLRYPSLVERITEKGVRI